MVQVLFFKLTLFFYFLGTSLFIFHLWDKNGPPAAEASLSWSQRLTVFVTAIGFLFHTLALILHIQETAVPFSNLHEAISFFSWAMVLVFFLVEFRFHLYVLGSFILPLAFLSLVSTTALPDAPARLNPTLKTAWFGLHTTLSLLGIASFAIAAITGLMYLLQENFLKSKRFNPIYHKLPSLDLLDRWNQKMILVGFSLFTLGIISGALWSQYSFGSFWSSNNPKLVLSLGTWFFYLIVLHGRITIGWRAKKAAHLAILGFVGAILIFISLV